MLLPIPFRIRFSMVGRADTIQSSRVGRFAVVAYLPEPLSSLLSGLQSALPGDRCARPHVTLLPPRPLSGSLEQVSDEITGLIEKCSPFDVELAEVCCFPDTNVLYLSMSAGRREIAAIHAHLDAQFPTYREEFEFLPHVTLSGTVPSEDIGIVMAATQAAWSNLPCSRRFRVDRTEFLWLTSKGQKADWKSLWSREIGQSVSPAIS